VGPERCFLLGLAIYGVGALISAFSPGLGILIFGNSILEGVGTALLIPPVYILTTMLFSDLTSRARAFGVITGMGGIGAAAGPLIGGIIATGISWRAAFIFQAVIIAIILLLSRRIADPVPPDPTRPFDVVGTILSAAGLVCLVMGILQADNSLTPMAILLAVGVLFLVWFFLHVRAQERASREPPLSTALFRNRTSNSRTQNVQWLLLMGVAFVVSASGEISGLSRSVSNLGSSLGTAIAGTILVAGLATPGRAYALAMIVSAGIGLIGLIATLCLPARISNAP
jgi:MFS family permease